MKKKEKREVCETIENEGFNYTFRDYSSFEEIKDEEFHRLRIAYIDAAQALENYIGWTKYEEEMDS